MSTTSIIRTAGTPTTTRPSAADLLGEGGPVFSVLASAEVRPAQLAMAQAVQRALETPGHRLLVEAPTGTGKSLAYLCAAALADSPHADRGFRVVVATGTKTLQDQLAEIDAPQMRRALRMAGLPEPNVEVVKGRRNYLCQLRLSRWQPAVLGDDNTLRLVKRIRRWADQTHVGDRTEVGELADDNPLWGELDADGDACVGSRCQYHESCFVTRLRARAREAHIIITNHSLLCADLRLREEGGVAEARVLPPYDALIIDEAHKLPGVAAEHFGVSVGPTRVEAACRDALRMPGHPEGNPAVQGAVTRLLRCGQLAFARVATALGPTTADGTRVRFRMVEHPEVQQACLDLMAALEDTRAQVEAHAVLAPEARAESEALVRRLEVLLTETGHVTQAQDSRFGYCAEKRGARGRLMSYPADVSSLLANTLLAGPGPVVFTSATLALDGDFTGIRADLGMGPDDDVEEVVLPHTFSAEQAVMYVPRDLPDPDAPDFMDRATARVVDLVNLTGGGAFLLCTTTRAMATYAARLSDALPSVLVLRQGQAPKAELVARFKRDGNALLVATHSFWEGVDVRGSALRLVMVDKLPFAPPHDPLVAARLERAENEGRRPFEDVQLGDAVMALRQGLGRLLRSREDRGVLCVMDGRLWRRSYGKRVLGALGNHPLTHVWADLEAHAQRLQLKA